MRKEYMNSLKKRITERNLHGAFIAPILSKEEKDELRQMFDRPFVFVISKGNLPLFTGVVNNF